MWVRQYITPESKILLRKIFEIAFAISFDKSNAFRHFLSRKFGLLAVEISYHKSIEYAIQYIDYTKLVTLDVCSIYNHYGIKLEDYPKITLEQEKCN